MKRIGIGTKFRWTNADSNPLWEVKRARGRGTWDCEVVEGPDWVGTVKTFSSEEIRSSLGMAAAWKQSRDESEQFYQNLTPGSIVHYNNGFNSFVRCRVSDNHELLPFALVGDWREFDLPQRQLDGTVYLGYHAERIVAASPFKPHASNVYEHRHDARSIDPRNLPAINLDVPPMTAEQEEMAKKYKTLDAIRQLVRTNENPDVIFESIRGLIG